jgi:hypothetical protein
MPGLLHYKTSYDPGLETYLGVFLASKKRQDATPDDMYSDFCVARGSCVRPCVKFEDKDLFPRTVNYVLRHIVKNMYDNEAQKSLRLILRHLVGDEAGKKMIAYAELLSLCQEA